ncbi:REP element-mobilizing transposase RayT [Mucilaginibacter yixingensis]|uniref:REP element-mobilizing transposase RayT n=1 Tax=Mucilaginibacter yixingensis TaxID=1295612 RepID=A0A2T5JET4_9SPHI|nr:transposase [Mucilaginibacter yixingensis]PTR00948.1 REP element-mobilizing transposase RayT [Mucilaginibacter yixingensis]
MSELRKATSDRAYFITMTVVGWIDVFTRKDYCEEIIRNLEYCRQYKKLKLFAYCIMSNHIHLIVQQEDSRLADVLRDFKSYTAKRIIEMIINNPSESRTEWMIHLFKYHANMSGQNSEFQFWQKTGHPVELLTEEVFAQKMNYIHQNPVEAMLVNDAGSYVFSSANPDSPLKMDWD